MDLLGRCEPFCTLDPGHDGACVPVEPQSWQATAESLMTEKLALQQQLEGAVEAERKRIADYLRSRAADNWDPSVEAALRQVAHEVHRDYHHGGR